MPAGFRVRRGRRLERFEDALGPCAARVEQHSPHVGRDSDAASKEELAVVSEALEQPGVVAVAATTLPWHAASLRVMIKLGMVHVGTREHETLGELVVYELRRRD